MYLRRYLTQKKQFFFHEKIKKTIEKKTKKTEPAVTSTPLVRKQIPCIAQL